MLLEDWFGFHLTGIVNMSLKLPMDFGLEVFKQTDVQSWVSFDQSILASLVQLYFVLRDGWVPRPEGAPLFLFLFILSLTSLLNLFWWLFWLRPAFGFAARCLGRVVLAPGASAVWFWCCSHMPGICRGFGMSA